MSSKKRGLEFHQGLCPQPSARIDRDLDDDTAMYPIGPSLAKDSQTHEQWVLSAIRLCEEAEKRLTSYHEQLVKDAEEMRRIAKALGLTPPASKPHPLDKTRACPSCGKQTRITTAGCDHCNLEDK